MINNIVKYFFGFSFLGARGTYRFSKRVIKGVYRGVSINELAKMMGHTETRTTERYADADRDMYVKLRKEENDPVYA